MENDNDWLDVQEAFYKQKPDRALAICSTLRGINRRYNQSAVSEAYSKYMADGERKRYKAKAPSTSAYVSFHLWLTGNYCPDVW